jgi:hypothetical protein
MQRRRLSAGRIERVVRGQDSTSAIISLANFHNNPVSIDSGNLLAAGYTVDIGTAVYASICPVDNIDDIVQVVPLIKPKGSV